MNEQEYNNNQNSTEKETFNRSHTLSRMYENWFLDYASYVILERAVPSINDGLKPVQRRILHAMRELDDGRYNKVANLIGHTMKYHPHGDSAIGNALVALGQKELMVDTQGNWGNLLTGDSAAAPRYIEARLSDFAKEVAFNPKTTEWTLSYDGRNQEPVNLPVKFPLLLNHGVEGIAVGLASKILPHNFLELIDACICVLRDEEFVIYPDFQTGGMLDVSRYNDGKKGGRIRIRAKIVKIDKKTLVITELPFGQTTNTIIESIISANDKGKIKIKKIDDNTSEKVEIMIHLQNNVSIDQTIDALYAFTFCEVSVSPNACVIDDNKPRFLGVSEILRKSVHGAKHILQRELEIEQQELKEKLLFSSLEKIFIENRIYRNIETCESFEEIVQTIDDGLTPYKPEFYREITRDDIIKLTEIRIKRISRHDAFKSEAYMDKLLGELKQVQHNLENLTQYAIDYYSRIKEKYGEGRERNTEIRDFENIEAAMVAVANQKLYFDKEGGFAGIGLKKASFVCDCSDMDDMIVFRADGTFAVTKVDDKVYVGKEVIHIDIFKKNDERTIYNVIYRNGLHGRYYVKRFPVKGITRDKQYDITQGEDKSKIIYFSANPNGEAEVVRVGMYPRPRMKTAAFDFDFSDLDIRGRVAKGNILSRFPIKRVTKKGDGISTLGGMDIWLDDNVMRLNREEYGKYLGSFKGEDKIIAFYEEYRFMQIYGYDLSIHFEENINSIKKFSKNRVYTVVYFNGEKQNYYVKRFQGEISEKAQLVVDEHPDTKVVFFSEDKHPRINLVFTQHPNRKEREDEEISLSEFIEIRNYKAMGNRLSRYDIDHIEVLESLHETLLEDEFSEHHDDEVDNDSPGGDDSLQSADIPYFPDDLGDDEDPQYKPIGKQLDIPLDL